MVRYHGLSGLIGVAGRRSDVGGKRDGIDGPRRPAGSRAHHQTAFVRFVFQNLDKRSLQSGGAQFCGLLQNLPEVPGLHGDAPELTKQRLLPQSIAKLVAARSAGVTIDRFRAHLAKHTNSPNTGCSPAMTPEISNVCLD